MRKSGQRDLRQAHLAGEVRRAAAFDRDIQYEPAIEYDESPSGLPVGRRVAERGVADAGHIVDHRVGPGARIVLDVVSIRREHVSRRGTLVEGDVSDDVNR